MVKAPQPASETPAPARKFRPIRLRYLLPNLFTLLALCSGITAIRFAIENHFDYAVGGIVLAMALDAVDGRLARMLQGASRFGAELDSLADFVNFGVAPAIMLHLWALDDLKAMGWVVCLIFAIACALRLARFNVAIDEPKKPAWMGGYFTGIPAPAGALLGLLPLYLKFLGLITEGHPYAKSIALYEFLVAVLMVSRVPTFSGKNLTRVPREYALPLLAVMAGIVVMLISYPWETLAVFAVLYLGLIPVSVLAYQRLKRTHGA